MTRPLVVFAAAAVLGAVVLPACTAPAKTLSMEEARARFASQGPQPGQPLPPLSLTDLNGKSVDLKSIQGNKPMVLVTASLTCTVAQYRQESMDDMAKRFGDKAAFVVLYTIEAHPKGDLCPYTGEEWAMDANARQGIVHRQPSTLAQRQQLARLYQTKFAPGATIVVDTIDNASWKAVGQAPNLGLLIDSTGMVREREGWFEPEQMEAALARLGVTPNSPPPPPKKPS